MSELNFEEKIALALEDADRFRAYCALRLEVKRLEDMESFYKAELDHAKDERDEARRVAEGLCNSINRLIGYATLLRVEGYKDDTGLNEVLAEANRRYLAALAAHPSHGMKKAEGKR